MDDSVGSAVSEIVHRCGDKRVRYLRNEINYGPALSYQRAITEASGPVLAILNDDDVWELNLAARLVRGPGHILRCPWWPSPITG